MNSAPMIASVAELDDLLARRTSPFLEVWAKNDQRSLAALINGEVGWLTLFRFDGDGGLSTIDPDCENENYIPFRLNNGQMDEYPECYCVPLALLKSAFAHFFTTGGADPALTWTEDP